MMDVRCGGNPQDVMTSISDRLRGDYLVKRAFTPGALHMTYTHIDRMIVGGASPTDAVLTIGDAAKRVALWRAAF
jgi:4-deoxy-L-threo-5-hexosulose-uronate ketol-isomerase